MKNRKNTAIIIAAELVVIGILFVIIGFMELNRDKQKSFVNRTAGNEQGEMQKADAGNNTDKAAEKADNKKNNKSKQTPEEEAELARIAAEEKAERERIAAEEEAERIRIAEEEEKRRREEEKLLQLSAVKEKAILLAAQYDYQAAIDLLKEQEGYEDNAEFVELVANFTEQQAACVKWPDNTTISHLFVHSLIVDTSRAFGPKSKQAQGYNINMTTVSEFNEMLEEMYAKGYVIISSHDMAERIIDENGVEKLVSKPIYLPEGKIPFVLSQDDVNYYDTQDGDGLGERIVVGEDGLPTVEYILEDGTAVYGEYDMVPIVDRFVREHPDFSYHGRKGILGITGFFGALGYNTGLSMKMYDGMLEDEKMALINAEKEQAVKVAECLKADGWEFASHSYTHSYMGQISVDRFLYDLKRWKEEVEPILGYTDIYIYPYGDDICAWMGYSGEKYELMKEYGFWYFHNVDASVPYWVQIRDGYLRQGRINADGQRMREAPEFLSRFFDVDKVYDKTRP